MIEPRPVTRLLVANRGEIARRIFRTARAMGCLTVAVYADDDTHAPFVTEADLAVPLDGASPAQTYLNVDALLAAAAVTGADAVHPGYGFLSENAAFARAVIDAGLAWVGPPPAAIAAMGDKLAAKDMMRAAGVPTLASVEVSDGAAPSEAALADAALSYPLLVKAAAGGGGRGMRVVERHDDLADAIAAARREAAGAFGDDTVFVERYLAASRHVEVQVLGDLSGNLVHCFERECSIQRRHQKVIEEAPSPAVTPALRQRITDAALTAVRQLDYCSAGTVEFLVAGEGDGAEFFFLEINTRLQVEHPVTEAVTGLDLVREQLRIAAGEPLGYSQGDLTLNGWAIEARLYAEDPATGFLPTDGTLDVWAPAGAARWDSGVERHSTVSVAFDPMLAKVITHAPTRGEAAAALAHELERSRIGGVTTNRDFLVAALRHAEFIDGNTTADFIERTGVAAATSADGGFVAAAAAAVAMVSAARNRDCATTLAFVPSGYRNSVMPPEVLPLTLVSSHGPSGGSGDGPSGRPGEHAGGATNAAGGDVTVSYRRQRDGTWEVAVGERSWTTRLLRCDLTYPAEHRPLAGAPSTRPGPPGVDARLEVAVDDVRGTWQISATGDRWYALGPAGGSATFAQRSRFPAPDASVVEGGLAAPMPGKVLTVAASEGSQVTRGAVLVVMEAMKMEHQIVAPSDGSVAEVRVTEGDQVASGEVLVVLTAS